ncbi:beta-N-acetylglucosaminidase domain-containing protein [Paenibacillus sp. LHD-117]|uniref:beta-N-acetylglucosaminidase domain-containing protein n=1 Tax=Paenibacillus sp. LHD-117 TaxID=3071412 RepID=UPI0027E20C76|nr:beta-N-acetylglucosaminidase domain-containing protein [Paenibacillus sp. LHD-117]MDQ6422953.1 beta-N-acetylglucosaminidase domain-containing protein [Paenibacillus sp. LHD-117]
MSKKTVSLLASILMLSSVFTSAASAASDSPSNEPAAASVPYEIYPLPQKTTYTGTNVTLTDEVNIVFESAIDEYTENFLEKMLSENGIEAATSEAIVADKTNILIGVKDSDGYVDAYFDAHINYDADIFANQDAYVLEIDDQEADADHIAILGADTDSAYYGLASLKMILDQASESEVQEVKIEDFADTNFRGFIEGFYGFPWSHEDRISLMRFGGTMKMNSYIFAPKDDKYHNSAWRTLYPAAELAKIKELVDVGHESKTQFVWAIHPGFNMINWNNYDAELATLIAKLEQLYGIGVRQFGLFMDDISTSQSLTDKDKHVKLITDVANWVASKGDVKSLIYCPPFYNQSWTGAGGKPYLQALANVPENVEIMWTGRGVVGTVNTADMQWPKDAHGRDPYVWLNWPVNDYKDSRLMLGKGEVLKPGTHNISGVVSNPMGHAELSKIALFAVADYTWNVDDFNVDKSWIDSFGYVAPEVASELNAIAYHLSDPSPSGHGLVVGESENIKEELESFLTRYASGQSVAEVGQTLIEEFDHVLNAIDSFRANIQNPAMLEEINPWLNVLHHVLQADKSVVLSALAVQNGELDAAWEELAKATSAMAASKSFKIKKLNAPDVTVEAGAKRLVPFAQQLLNKLDAQIYSSIDPDFVIPVATSSYGSVNGLNKMVDGDLSTNVYIQTLQKNGDWFGLDLGKTVQVNDVTITQGRTDSDHDIFQRGILEYSADGQTWTAIGEERSGFKIAVKELELEARYIRYRLTHAGVPGGKPDLWTAVREFAVNENTGKAGIYTNVPGLKDTAVASTPTSVEIANLSQITLQASEYVGMKLQSIEQIAEVTLASANPEVVMESSENGVEWTAVTAAAPYNDAAYFRLINKGDQAVTFDLGRLFVKLNKFTEPVVTHNYGSIYQGNISQVYNADLVNKVWFGSIQTAGKYVQVDMGGVVNVRNVAVVIGDGEGDFFRKGDLQLSADGQNWITIHSFNNPGDRSLNFPEHEVPYRYKRVQVEETAARYVRLISTQTHDAWFALNEIIVNEGLDRPGSENPSIQVNPQGATGNEGLYAIDHQLSTFYTPSGEPATGQLTYKLSNETKLGEVIILQNPSRISNAAVSVRDAKGWHEAGTLSESFNRIDTSDMEDVLEVRLQWNGAVKPQIHEIIPVKRDGDVVIPEGPATSLTGDDTVVGGQEFEVQYGIKQVEGLKYAASIVLTYDPNVMSFVSAAELQPGISIIKTVSDTPGQIQLIMASQGANHPITGDTQLAKLTFRALDVPETTEGQMTVSQTILGDAEGTETGLAPSTYRIEITAVPKGMEGDVNGDDRVSVGDLALIAANYGKDEDSADWAQVKHLDVKADGSIDLLDLALVAKKILG